MLETDTITKNKNHMQLHLVQQKLKAAVSVPNGKTGAQRAVRRVEEVCTSSVVKAEHEVGDAGEDEGLQQVVGHFNEALR